MKTTADKRIGFICIAIATVLFSSMEITLKTLVDDFAPLQITLARFLVGGLVLLAPALMRLRQKQLSITGRDLGRFLLLGFLGIVVSMNFYQLAITQINASAVAVLFSSNPLFVTVLAYLLLGEVIYRRNVVGLLLDIVGILCIINPLQMSINLPGTLCALAATVAFALYGVGSKKTGQSHGALVVTCFGFLSGSLEMLLLTILSHVPAIAEFLLAHDLGLFARIPVLSGYSWQTLPAFLLVSVGVTGIGYTAYFIGMEKTSAATGSLVFFFKPVLATLLSVWILAEQIVPSMILGIAFMLAGSLVTILPELRRQKTAG
ncbi:MAG: DMT family transporter [Lachnospiraceae bacterium]